ncbi:hypothetical protein E2C01_041561 [Portunus trituberculatus]|uniref:Uncharacterized protein n=1 Tax=Portunus trituberculatus TaxID=210409 RepID=A0A5B7FU18_PORTR|nr:hypothetical protein [Portunus trituberculatus]
MANKAPDIHLPSTRTPGIALYCLTGACNRHPARRAIRARIYVALSSQSTIDSSHPNCFSLAQGLMGGREWGENMGEEEGDRDKWEKKRHPPPLHVSAFPAGHFLDAAPAPISQASPPPRAATARVTLIAACCDGLKGL